VIEMNLPDLVVIAAALVLIGGLAWFFFGPRKARAAQLVGNVQEVEVTVRGGYSPDLVRARQGVPLRIVFDRKESGDCTSRVVFPDFAVNQPLPAFAQTAVQFVPSRAGEFGNPTLREGDADVANRRARSYDGQRRRHGLGCSDAFEGGVDSDAARRLPLAAAERSWAGASEGSPPPRSPTLPPTSTPRRTGSRPSAVRSASWSTPPTGG
jgi:hypothetical protein